MDDRKREFIGADKNIRFEGQVSGGVQIPGGLREAAAKEPPAPKPAPKRPKVQEHHEPEFIGADRKIAFEGQVSGGVQIPGGLREPVKKPAA